MSDNIVEFMCESEDLVNACKLFSASKKRNFLIVQISPAVRVSIGEYFGLYRGEDAVGKVVAALTMLGADVVVDSAIAFDALTLMRVKALQQAKDTGEGLPLFSSECAKWVELAKNEYPETAAKLLPSATSVCAKLLKKYYSMQMSDKKIRVIALEMGDAKKMEPDVDIVLTLDELGQLLSATGINVRLMKKAALEAPFGVGSGASYIAAASGGDAEAVARCLTKDKTQNSFRKFGYCGLYDNKARREVCLDLDGETWNFAVVDSLDEAAAVMADVQSGAKAYDYVEVTACAGGQIGFGCDLNSEEGEMTKRLRKLGLQYLDMARAARSADASAAAAAVVKEWNVMCRNGEAAAYDVIDEIVEDYDEEEIVEAIEESGEDIVEDIVEETIEEAVEEIVEAVMEEDVPEEIIEEVVEDVVEEIIEEIVEEIVEEVVEEVVGEAIEEPAEEVVEEIVEEAIEEPDEEVMEEVVEEAIEEPAEEVVEEIVEEAIEEPAEEVVEEVVEEVIEEPAEEVLEEVVEEVIEEPAEEVVEEVVEEAIEEPAEEVVEEVVEEAIEEPAEEVVEEVVEEAIEEPAEEVVEEEPAIEEPVVEEPVVKVTKEEIEAEMAHVEELLSVAMEDLTPAQKAARNIYYRRLSTKDRHKLKRLKRNQKKN